MSGTSEHRAQPQSWRSGAEEHRMLAGFCDGEFSELRRREQELRHENEALQRELALRRREMGLMAQQASRIFSDKSEELQQLERQHHMTRLSLDIAMASMGGEIGDALLARLLQAVIGATGAEGAAVFALREGAFKLVAVRGLHADAFVRLPVLELGTSVTGLIAQFRQPVVIAQPLAQFVLWQELEQAPFESLAAIPLLAGEELVGAMELASASTFPMTSSELQPLMDLGAFVRSSLVGSIGKSGLVPFQ